jgi:death on curing protein
VSPKPLQFLTSEDVLRIHEVALKDQGGDPSMRDAGLLDSALAQPKQQFGGEYLHADIPSMAAAYAFHICLNHPFVDGNKRAGTAAMIMFLSDNGWSFDASADEAEPVILELAAGKLSKAALTGWLRAQCHENPSLELRTFFRELTLPEFLRAIESLPHGGTGSTFEGFSATCDEAFEAMPLVREFGMMMLEGAAAAPAERLERQRAVALTLVALFRIAEDKGYEW